MARAVAAVLILTLAGCNQFPRGAAIRADIEREIALDDSGFAFYPVTRALIPTVSQWPAVNAVAHDGWPRRTQGAEGSLIAPGDGLTFTIWDSSDNSLLTPAGQPKTTLGPLLVSSSGRIFLPYVGEVRVAGMSVDRARERIQEELEPISPSAQVIVMQETGRKNSVDLVAGVARPGSYPLPSRNHSILGLIAEGGGVPGSMNNPRIKLQRGSKVYAISVQTLYDNPEADSVLVGGDKIIVEEDDRYFLALGAAGREQQVHFNSDEISALDAIAQIGGVADSTADPEGILILREYPASAIAAGVRGPRDQGVIFSVNITTADGLFAARNLKVMPGDLIMATESPVNSIQKAFQLIGSAFGLAGRIDNF